MSWLLSFLLPLTFLPRPNPIRMKQSDSENKCGTQRKPLPTTADDIIGSNTYTTLQTVLTLSLYVSYGLLANFKTITFSESLQVFVTLYLTFLILIFLTY